MRHTVIILLLLVVSFVSKAQAADSIVINLSDGEKPARMAAPYEGCETEGQEA